MKKNTLKYVLDILLFIQVCSVVAVGMLQGPEPGSSRINHSKAKIGIKNQGFLYQIGYLFTSLPGNLHPGT
jgi:hypothetical protein